MKNQIINDEFISRLETMTLHMQSPMQGYFGGNHRTNKYGSTVEFADFREYMLGDDIRRIDWNLYSRFEKYFIKLFVDERQMHLQLFLDCSASMHKGNSNKSIYALKTIAAIGFLSVQNMDKTSVRLIKGDFADDLCGLITGKESFYRAMSLLEDSDFHGTANIENAIINCPGMGSNDGLTVIVSDFLTESNWKKAVDYLLYKNRQIMLIQVLSPEEINPAFSGRMHFKDSEASDPLDERNMKMKITRSNLTAYKQALADYIADIKIFCTKRGVLFFSVNCDDPIEKLIFGDLYEMGTIR